MDEVEKQIWIAAFAAAHEAEYQYAHTTAGANTKIHPFTIAERADHALASFRAAMKDDNAPYLEGPREWGWISDD